VAKQYVADIKDRDIVNTVFLVKDKIMAMAKNGKPYMNLRFMDKSGDVDAKIWDNTDTLDKLFDKDDFVQVRGKASVYMNKMQVVVSDIVKVPEDQVDLAHFLPESPRGISEMRQELHEVVMALASPPLRRLMELFLADADFMGLYCMAPAAIMFIWAGCWSIPWHWPSWQRRLCRFMGRGSMRTCSLSVPCCTMWGKSMR